MMIALDRFIRRLRRKKSLGIGLVVALVFLCVSGNALTYYIFERDTTPGLTLFDTFWYSAVSITTIGYGDFYPVSLEARIGTAVFIMLVGLTAVTTAFGIGVDWILELQFKERSGMGSPGAKNHVLIVNFPNERRVRQIIEEFLQDPHHRNDDIVVVTDRIESMPFTLPNVSFVRGSPLEEETYVRARAEKARQAIVLSSGYDDPNSDSLAASIASIIEHVNPGISIVAECLNAKHSLLFSSTRNVSLVYTFRLSNNLLVQEAQDPGVTMVTQAMTSNDFEGTLASTEITGEMGGALSYNELAGKLLSNKVNLVGVIRGDEVILGFDDLAVAEHDRLVYLSAKRQDWQTLQSFVWP